MDKKAFEEKVLGLSEASKVVVYQLIEPLHAHYMKFVEWVRNYATAEITFTSKGREWMFTLKNEEIYFNDEELYQYWLDNIADKS